MALPNLSSGIYSNYIKPSSYAHAVDRKAYGKFNYRKKCNDVVYPWAIAPPRQNAQVAQEQTSTPWLYTLSSLPPYLDNPAAKFMSSYATGYLENGGPEDELDRNDACGVNHQAADTSYTTDPAKTTSRTKQQFVELDKARNRASQFHYPAINFSRRQIRLVRVVSPKNSRYLACEFELAIVDDPSAHYIALSYTWGVAEKEDDILAILLHGQQFWIRKNLFDFLGQVCSDPSLHNKLYWIDAMCIDQEKNGVNGHQEKNHQVGMMGQIYENAQEVISWLGTPRHDMQRSLAFVEACFANGFPFQKYNDGFTHSISERNKRRILKGLEYIGTSNYWTRIWVVQEVVKAKKVSLRSGSYRFPWRRYWTMDMLLGPEVASLTVAAKISRWDKYRKNKKLTLLDCLWEFGSQECSDPRDRIYALLGIMEPLPIKADYSKTSEEVYEEVTQYLLSRGITDADYNEDLREALELSPSDSELDSEML